MRDGGRAEKLLQSSKEPVWLDRSLLAWQSTLIHGGCCHAELFLVTCGFENRLCSTSSVAPRCQVKGTVLSPVKVVAFGFGSMFFV